MKRLLLLLAVAVAGSASHAITADRFNCTITLQDLKTGISTQETKDFFVGRLPNYPTPANPSPVPPGGDIQYTSGSFNDGINLDVGPGVLSGSLNVYYEHAVQMDASGNPIQARQSMCVTLSGNYCPKGPKLCAVGMSSCAFAANPFDPNSGWTDATLINGVPVFDQQGLAPMATPIMDDNHQAIGHMNVNCQFSGTYQ